jgi:hypothetical protein
MLAGLLSLVMFALGATPAAAETSVGVIAADSGHVAALGSSQDGTTHVRVSVTFTGVLVGNGLQMVVECDALGVGLVAATSVDECAVYVDGQRYDVPPAVDNAPGPLAVVAGTVHTPVSDISVCVGGRAVPVLGDDAYARRCFDSAVTLDVNPPPMRPSPTSVKGVGVVEQVGSSAVFACAAVASQSAVATSVIECTLDSGWAAPRVTMPGPLAATSGVGHHAAGILRVCYTVEAVSLSGQTARTSGCSGPMLQQAVSGPDDPPELPTLRNEG